MSPRTRSQRRPHGRDRQDVCGLQRGVWPPTLRGGTPSSPHIHAHPSPPSTHGMLTTGARGTMSSLQGQALHWFTSRLLQATSIFILIYLSPVSFLTGCFWGRNEQKEG